MSFRQTGTYLANKLGREKAFDHKMISNRYNNYYKAIGNRLKTKTASQRQHLYGKEKMINNLDEQYG
ncbi:hypothetical protein ABE042_12275 [Viridibacillus arvi]|uniref:hypothetical protein n=1 Tax=Viridibacillus arvi TaxID=263475 RepID=UPI003D2755BB